MAITNPKVSEQRMKDEYAMDKAFYGVKRVEKTATHSTHIGMSGNTTVTWTFKSSSVTKIVTQNNIVIDKMYCDK